MNYLLIDTSNQPLSVALMQDNQVIAEKTTNIKQNHSVQLMPEIQNYLNNLRLINKILRILLWQKGQVLIQV